MQVWICLRSCAYAHVLLFISACMDKHYFIVIIREHMLVVTIAWTTLRTILGSGIHIITLDHLQCTFSHLGQLASLLVEKYVSRGHLSDEAVQFSISLIDIDKSEDRCEKLLEINNCLVHVITQGSEYETDCTIWANLNEGTVRTEMREAH